MLEFWGRILVLSSLYSKLKLSSREFLEGALVFTGKALMQ